MVLLPSKPFAGIGVTYACREEAEAERQHDDIKHEWLHCIASGEAKQATAHPWS